MIGTILRGRYAILKQLGSGGFGETYIAEDLDLPGSPQCVVKRLQPQSHDPFVLQTAKRLFDTEAAVLYQLGSHDQIPRLMAHFEENQQFYLVQEFVDGRDLSQELFPGVRWSEARVLAFLRDALGILEFVHQQNVIHRDIKPANLIGRMADDRLVLIDFGAVKEIRALSTVGPGRSYGSVGSVAIGTPGYMPGEQAVGKPRFSSDIYALGITAIQALTGLSPDKLQEDPHTGEVSWRSHAQVSEATARIIDKMVRSHFRDRYQSVRAVINDLDLIGMRSVLNPLPTSKIATLVAVIGITIVLVSIGIAVARLFPPQAPSAPLIGGTPIPISSSPVTPTSPPTTQAQNQSSPTQVDLDKWVGTYTFSEAAPPPKFGSTMTMSYKIAIAKRGNSYIADIDRDGFQTLQRLSSEVRLTSDRKIGFYFTNYREDNVGGRYQQGDLLFHMETLPNSSTKVIWGIMLGLLERQELVPTDLVFVAK